MLLYLWKNYYSPFLLLLLISIIFVLLNNIDNNTDAIFIARQMQENFRVKGKKLYFGFVDLEKLLTGYQEK